MAWPFSKERKIQRAIKKTLNKLAQSPDRWAAMEFLRDHGTEEALYTLFQRLSITSSKEVEDHQEKAWVVDTLVAKDLQAIAPLRKYCKTSDTIARALEIMGRILGKDKEKTFEVIDEILAREEPGYTRDPIKRIQTIDWLAEWKGADNEEVLDRVRPYLADFDENVRFAAVNCYAQHMHPGVAEDLLGVLLNEEEDSRRLKVRVAELIADNDLDLGGRQSEIGELTDDVLSDFKIRQKKLVKKGGK
jgi:hypothetical protein